MIQFVLPVVKLLYHLLQQLSLTLCVAGAWLPATVTVHVSLLNTGIDTTDRPPLTYNKSNENTYKEIWLTSIATQTLHQVH